MTQLTRFYKHVKERPEVLSGISVPTNVNTRVMVNYGVPLTELFVLSEKIQHARQKEQSFSVRFKILQLFNLISC